MVGRGGGAVVGRGQEAAQLTLSSQSQLGAKAVTSNADNEHIMLAKSKPGAAAVMPVAMLARCGIESNKPGSRV